MLVKRSTGPFLELLRRDIDAGRIDLEAAARELFDPSPARTVKALARAATASSAGALPPFFALLRGERDGRPYRVGCHVTSLPPGMDGVTAIPAALAVDHLLAHPASPGVHAPDSVIEPEPLLASLLPHCPGRPASLDELAPISEAPA